MSELLDVKVPLEEQVEENDPTPPNPDTKSKGEREREAVLRSAAL